jgi:uncharacterized protein
MPLGIRQIPDFAALLLSLWVHLTLVNGLAQARWLQPGLRKRLVPVLKFTGVAWLLFGFLAGMPQIGGHLQYPTVVDWLRGMAIVYAIGAVGGYTISRAAAALAPRFNPSRRAAISVAIPAAICGYGVFVERSNYRLKEVDLPIPGLPPDLNGLRLVQLTDIHYGPYLGRGDLSYAIDMANETKAHLALVTGDLISLRKDPLDDCLDLLTRLKADAGIVGCLGNHEIVARCEAYTQEQALARGMRFLRHEALELTFGSARLNVAGVDYQRYRTRYLHKAERLLRPGATNILLSHNPDVFPVAAAQGWQATIAGHTHGGQITVEILGEHANLARFFTPYIYGLYREGNSSIYVSRGLGTVGAPIRLGAPPEVNLIKLCAISS